MSEKIKFNLELLTKIYSDNNITLLNDYSNEKITRETRIEGKCLTDECENNFDKTFRQLYNFGGYCKKCIYKNALENRKNTCITLYGVDNTFQNENKKNKIKETNIKRYGVEHPTQNKKIMEKIKKTNIQKYGVICTLQNEDVKNKCKDTFIKKYGIECPQQSQEVKEKTKETCLKKYGVEYTLQSPEIREKGKETCYQIYGVEHNSQSELIKQQKIDTCIKNWGVEYSLQSQEVKEKGKATCLIKYGVEYSQQNPEIAEKTLKASFKKKDYTLPSGNIIHVQGYEPYALDDLLCTINEDEIKTGAINAPKIWYYDNEGQKRRHFVDIYIPSQNRCIEVKSRWTFQMENVLLKQQAGKNLGYNYELWIYNSKGKKLECIL
jgi:hypothetical protein